MQNQQYTGTPTSRRFCACPSTIVAGQPVMLGSIPAVALDNYQSNEGGTTFMMGGSFVLTVVGQTVESPQTPHKINPGDKLYATGTLDPTTNVLYNLTIDANSANNFFGYLDPSTIQPSVGSGLTSTTAIVLLPQGA